MHTSDSLKKLLICDETMRRKRTFKTPDEENAQKRVERVRSKFGERESDMVRARDTSPALSRLLKNIYHINSDEPRKKRNRAMIRAKNSTK